VNHVTCHKKFPDHISNSLTFPGLQNSLTIPCFPGLWEPCQCSCRHAQWSHYTKPSSHSSSKLWYPWYPEYAPDQSQNSVDCSMIHTLLIPQISRKSTSNFFTILITSKQIKAFEDGEFWTVRAMLLTVLLVSIMEILNIHFQSLQIYIYQTLIVHINRHYPSAFICHPIFNNIPFAFTNSLSLSCQCQSLDHSCIIIISQNKRLNYCRGTTQCTISFEISLTVAQLYETRRPASADRTARHQFQAGLRGDVGL